jgi:hypothetical protein
LGHYPYHSASHFCMGSQVKLHAFLISALQWAKWSGSGLDRFKPKGHNRVNIVQEFERAPEPIWSSCSLNELKYYFSVL